MQGTGVTVWTAWNGERIASIGVLKIIEGDIAEMTSMRTLPDFLRMEARAVVLKTITTAAKRHGVQCLSLEMGSEPAFEPALRLYQCGEFVKGEAFGSYVSGEFNPSPSS